MYDSLLKFVTCASLDLIAAGILKSKFRSPGQFCVLGLIPVWFLWILSCFIQFCARGNVYPFVSISFRAMALNSLHNNINKSRDQYQLRQNVMIELRFSRLLIILHIYPSDDMSPDFNKSLHIASNSVGGTVNPKLPSDDGIFKSAAFDNWLIVLTESNGFMSFLSILKINEKIRLFLFCIVAEMIILAHKVKEQYNNVIRHWIE